MITKDGKPLRRQRAGRNVENHRREFAGNLVQVGNHQEQTLGRSERGGKRTGLQRAVNRARRPTLALQLDHRRNGLPQILDSGGGPLIGPFAHRRGRREGIDGYDFAELVGDVGYGLVGVESFEIRHLHPPKSISDRMDDGKSSLGEQ